MDKLDIEESMLFRTMVSDKERDLSQRAVYHRNKYNLTMGIVHLEKARQYEARLVTLQGLKKKVTTNLL